MLEVVAEVVLPLQRVRPSPFQTPRFRDPILQQRCK